MLRVRNSQIGLFETDSRDRFIEGLADHVRRHFTERTWDSSHSETVAKVEALARRAASLGLSMGEPAATYVILSFKLGCPVEAHALNWWVDELLRHSGLPAAEKMRIIDEVIHGETPFELVVPLLRGGAP